MRGEKRPRGGWPQCYVLKGVESERAKVAAEIGANVLVGWQQRIRENEQKYALAKESAQERGRRHNEWVMQRVQSRERAVLESVPNSTPIHKKRLRKPREQYHKAEPKRVQVVTKHPKKYAVGNRFDSVLSTGERLAGRIVKISPGNWQESSFLVIETDPGASYVDQQLGTYDLESRVKHIKALDDKFYANMAVARAHIEDDYASEMQSYIAKRPIYRSKEEKIEFEVWKRHLGGDDDDDDDGGGGNNGRRRLQLVRAPNAGRVAELEERERATAKLVDDAALLERLSRRYGAFDEDLVYRLERPGIAFKLRLDMAVYKITHFCRFHTQRRLFLRTWIALRLQAAFRARQARKLAWKIKQQRNVAWRGVIRLYRRRKARCFYSWVDFVRDRQRIKGNFKAMLLTRTRLVFCEWKKAVAKRKIVRGKLDARRRSRLRRYYITRWRQRVELLQRKRRFEARCLVLCKQRMFNTWAEYTATCLLDRFENMEFHAVYIQRVVRGYLVRRRQTAKLTVALALQSAWRGAKYRYEFNRDFGIKQRLIRVRDKRERKAAKRAREKKSRKKTRQKASSSSSSITTPPKTEKEDDKKQNDQIQDDDKEVRRRPTQAYGPEPRSMLDRINFFMMFLQ